MSNLENATKTLDMAYRYAKPKFTTSEMRIRGMSNIDSIMPAFGPKMMQFADLEIKRINEKDLPGLYRECRAVLGLHRQARITTK